MSDPFIGEIKMFGGNFAPRGYALCCGQMMAIAQNSALFSLLGTVYGGDGVSIFGLPDFQGRAPIHWGHGQGLSNVNLGERAGMETVTLQTGNIPPHVHAVTISSAEGISHTPLANGYLGAGADNNLNPIKLYTNVLTAPVSLNTSITGSGQPLQTRSPYQAVSFIIALAGLFPSRD